MRVVGAVAVVLLLLIGGTAWAFWPGQGSTEDLTLTADDEEPVLLDTSVTDAIGDAYVGGPDQLTRQAFCAPGISLGPACAARPETEVGREAAPEMDLAAVRLVSFDDEAVTLQVELASVTADLAGFQGSSLHQNVVLETCLAFSVLRCITTVAAHSEAGLAVTSNLRVLDEGCNEWHACIQQIQHTIVPGQPGAIRYQVPTAALLSGLETTEIRSVEAALWTETFDPLLPATHVAMTMYASSEHYHEHIGPVPNGDLVDVLPLQEVDWHIDVEPAMTVTPNQTTNSDGAITIVESGPGANWGGDSLLDHPRYDIREVRLSETPEELIVDFVLGDWDGFPVEDLHYVIELGTQGDAVYEIGVLKEGGEAYGYVGHCITYACTGAFRSSETGHNHGGWQQKLDVEERTEADTLRVAVPWDLIPTFNHGDDINFALTISMMANLAVYFGEYGDEHHGDVHQMSLMDIEFGSLPYTLQYGAESEDAGPDHEH